MIMKRESKFVNLESWTMNQKLDDEFEGKGKKGESWTLNPEPLNLKYGGGSNPPGTSQRLRNSLTPNP